MPADTQPVDEDQESEKLSVSTVSETQPTPADKEAKTTLETIREVISHPLATLSETIQSIMPTTASESTEEAEVRISSFNEIAMIVSDV